jgi:Yip1 domain
MDFAKIVARVKAILTTPRTEWPVIAAEPETVKGLYLNYIVVLAAIPPLANFIQYTLIGSSSMGVYIRLSLGRGIMQLVLQYLVSLGVVYLMALIVDALAPSFGGEKNLLQGLKTIAYAWTGYWIASIAIIVPWIGVLVVLAGLAYTVYLMYLGLPQTMKSPADRSGGYTAVAAVIGIVVTWIINMIVVGIFLKAFISV